MGGTCQAKVCLKNNSIGHAGPNTLIMIESWAEGGYTVNDDQGPSGELLIGGGQVAQGYFEHEDSESFFTDQNGMRWFRTGDIARLDPVTNAVSIIDRKKQLVKLLNGEYISLAKIEVDIMELDWTEAVCVLTRPDKQQMVAVIVPDWNASQFKECQAKTMTLSEKQALEEKLRKQ